MPAPDLAVGTFWTYKARGIFDVEKEFTVVVARADPSGYLFGASNESQLVTSATWERVWFGERDIELNPPYPYSVKQGRSVLFDFPLIDGKTWQAWPEGPNVTARIANITTPGGTFPGFSITGQEDDLKVEWDYVPALGFFTHYVMERNSRTYDVELIANGTGSGWVWFEKGPSATAYWTEPDSSVPQATLKGPAGMDAVVGLAYGQSGARGGLIRPTAGSAPWTFEGTGCCTSGDDWQPVNLPAEVGDWQLFVGTTDPDDWGELDLTAVKWIRS